jgi:hypothetical protein
MCPSRTTWTPSSSATCPDTGQASVDKLRFVHPTRAVGWMTLFHPPSPWNRQRGRGGEASSAVAAPWWTSCVLFTLRGPVKSAWEAAPVASDRQPRRGFPDRAPAPMNRFPPCGAQLPSIKRGPDAAVPRRQKRPVRPHLAARATHHCAVRLRNGRDILIPLASKSRIGLPSTVTEVGRVRLGQNTLSAVSARRPLPRVMVSR